MRNCEILELETKGCFDFFWNEISVYEKTYGFIKDSTAPFDTHKNVSSISSTGFGLCAIVVGVSRNYISYDEGYERVLKTLINMYENASHIKGFFNHFLDMNTGEKVWSSEVSIIDTSIFVMGAMVASEYFGRDITKYFKKIYRRIDWEFFRNKNTNRFYMGYNDEGKKHFGEWDSYAEQLIMYFLGVSSPTHRINKEMFYDFNRDKINFDGKQFIYSPFGSLFTHQFSHGFIDFRNKIDREEIDFFENSKIATLLNRQYCIENMKNSKSYNRNSWGITPCETPNGYIGTLGTPPCLDLSTQDGTIALYGSIGSIVFSPKESISAMNYIYKNFKDDIWGKYGFKDSYNLDKNWFCDYEIGIDKGISIVMIENYRTGLIWNLVMRNSYIKGAFKILEFIKIF